MAAAAQPGGWGGQQQQQQQVEEMPSELRIAAARAEKQKRMQVRQLGNAAGCDACGAARAEWQRCMPWKVFQLCSRTCGTCGECSKVACSLASLLLHWWLDQKHIQQLLLSVPCLPVWCPSFMRAQPPAVVTLFQCFPVAVVIGST
jgi:hypothetical protein